MPYYNGKGRRTKKRAISNRTEASIATRTRLVASSLRLPLFLRHSLGYLASLGNFTDTLKISHPMDDGARTKAMTIPLSGQSRVMYLNPSSLVLQKYLEVDVHPGFLIYLPTSMIERHGRLISRLFHFFLHLPRLQANDRLSFFLATTALDLLPMRNCQTYKCRAIQCHTVICLRFRTLASFQGRRSSYMSILFV